MCRLTGSPLRFKAKRKKEGGEGEEGFSCLHPHPIPTRQLRHCSVEVSSFSFLLTMEPVYWPTALKRLSKKNCLIKDIG